MDVIPRNKSNEIDEFQTLLWFICATRSSPMLNMLNILFISSCLWRFCLQRSQTTPLPSIQLINLEPVWSSVPFKMFPMMNEHEGGPRQRTNLYCLVQTKFVLTLFLTGNFRKDAACLFFVFFLSVRIFGVCKHWVGCKQALCLS